jgi:hypothetical protein
MSNLWRSFRCSFDVKLFRQAGTTVCSVNCPTNSALSFPTSSFLRTMPVVFSVAALLWPVDHLEHMPNTSRRQPRREVALHRPGALFDIGRVFWVCDLCTSPFCRLGGHGSLYSGNLNTTFGTSRGSLVIVVILFAHFRLRRMLGVEFSEREWCCRICCFQGCFGASLRAGRVSCWNSGFVKEDYQRDRETSDIDCWGVKMSIPDFDSA